MEPGACGAQLAGLTSLLLDTGPLVAYLNSRDPAHRWIAATLDEFSGQIHTTSAVITEAMHFVTRAAGQRAPFGPALLAEFITASSMRVHDLSHGARLHQAVALMQQYADAPMDYADATLVLLAEHLTVLEILTLDRRGFSFFRTPTGLPLQMIERP